MKFWGSGNKTGSAKTGQEIDTRQDSLPKPVHPVGKLRFNFWMQTGLSVIFLLSALAVIYVTMLGPSNNHLIKLLASQRAEGYAQAIATYLRSHQSDLNRLLAHSSTRKALKSTSESIVLDPNYWREAFADAHSLQLIPLDRMATAAPSFNALGFSPIEQDMIADAARGENVLPEVTNGPSGRMVTFVGRIEGATGDTIGVGMLHLRFGSMNKLLVTLAGLGSGEQGRVILQQAHNTRQPLVLADFGSLDGGESFTVDIASSNSWQLRLVPAEQAEDLLSVKLIPVALFFSLGCLCLIVVGWHAQRQFRGALIDDADHLSSYLQGRASDRSYPRPIMQLPALDSSLDVIEKVLGQILKRQPKMPEPEKKEALSAATPQDVSLAHSADSQAGAPGAGEPAASTPPVSSDSVAAGAAGEPPAHVFRAYDIRGIAGRELDEKFAYRLGQAIGCLVESRGESHVLVARDARLSSPKLTDRLIKGLLDTGMDVTNLGATPTPVLYFAANHMDIGTAIMVTGSHNPADYNGVKIMLDKKPLASGDIQDLRQRMIDGDFRQGTGSYIETDMRSDYLDAIFSNISTARSLKVVVDAGNGITGIIAPQLVEELGCDVIPLYCDVDGNFPNHHPDPTVPANLADLASAVKEHGADLGIAFDGDGDRLGVVDSNGDIIPADILLLLFARQVLATHAGASVVFDVKCSRLLPKGIKAAGGKSVMWKSGHSLIKQKMAEIGAPLGGEFSGHVCFADRWYGFDDGLYAAARLIEILSLGKTSLAEMLAGLPESLRTPELLLEVGDERKFAIMRVLEEQADFGPAQVNRLDGLRAEYSEGWGLIRASNTTPALSMRFEANSAENLERIQQKFKTIILDAFPDLAPAFD